MEIDGEIGKILRGSFILEHPLFRDFDRRKLVFMKNKHENRYQHEKIHQKSTFYRKIFPTKVLLVGEQRERFKE